jgi:hypothetical protein
MTFMAAPFWPKAAARAVLAAGTENDVVKRDEIMSPCR